ncbi:hypothetical protein [Desulfogranum marinum]|uniref:hypothetical protein n=1 Tax=Desulfogranum marinum TaxID=453220 RepID=UPI0029C6FEE7|nr:hypothetical protein [Desulfogranum marinum]
MDSANKGANFSQCSPRVSPGDAIFGSILAVNIGNYRSLRYLFTAKNFEPVAA